MSARWPDDRDREPGWEISNRGALLLCLLAYGFFVASCLYGLHR